ncbi:unnamed protein product [Rotaria sordida]|uniref:GTP cyclohydrolase II domain-containing protein n=1 Tax=Rotaria sordida TaxID=392033 RepID=A0A815BB25_9BILA|nr:unnamed protein product [Rotaria sordida]
MTDMTNNEIKNLRGKTVIRPLRGTTLYIAECNVDTRFGDFHAYVFQDLIGKHYIMALTYGKVKDKDKPFYIRLHSSCVTSETLRGSDCDCVQQLEGAMKIISEKKHGILFYLLQEGRGAGYVGKSRDRMLVQASYDQISTFEAYTVMGLKKDHRHYENIPQICDLLGIGNAKFILLTNNPDKIQAMNDLKLEVIRTEPLEFESSPFNAAYLASKQASGHLLRSASHSTLRGKSAPEPVPLFKPTIVPNAQRFIYCASYYLPMKPINDEILLTDKQFYEMFKHRPIDYYINMPNACILHYQALRNNRFLIKIDVTNLQKHEEYCRNDPVCELLTTPYWFKIHVYYDIISTREFIILTHGTVSMSHYPIVRLQMESLFNRFPLRHATHRDRLKQSVQLIVRYGVGIILLLADDGRGAGFGAYAVDRMLLERGEVPHSDAARKTICVDHDANDYDGTIALLQNHCPQKKIQLIMNTSSSILKKKACINALADYKFEVKKWLFLQQEEL